MEQKALSLWGVQLHSLNFCMKFTCWSVSDIVELPLFHREIRWCWVSILVLHGSFSKSTSPSEFSYRIYFIFGTYFLYLAFQNNTLSINKKNSFPSSFCPNMNSYWSFEFFILKLSCSTFYDSQTFSMEICFKYF